MFRTAPSAAGVSVLDGPYRSGGREFAFERRSKDQKYSRC